MRDLEIIIFHPPATGPALGAGALDVGEGLSSANERAALGQTQTRTALTTQTQTGPGHWPTGAVLILAANIAKLTLCAKILGAEADIGKYFKSWSLTPCLVQGREHCKLFKSVHQAPRLRITHFANLTNSITAKNATLSQSLFEMSNFS